MAKQSCSLVPAVAYRLEPDGTRLYLCAVHIPGNEQVSSHPAGARNRSLAEWFRSHFAKTRRSAADSG